MNEPGYGDLFSHESRPEFDDHISALTIPGQMVLPFEKDLPWGDAKHPDWRSSPGIFDPAITKSPLPSGRALELLHQAANDETDRGD